MARGAAGKCRLQASRFASLRALRPLPRRSELATRSRASSLVVRASGEGTPVEGKKEPFGLGGPGTYFGFGTKQEIYVGRMAMLGFTTGIIMEVLTGKGVIAQLGLDPTIVRFPFLLGLVFLLVGGLLGGYVVINNPPNFDRAPVNEGAGVPRDPLRTFDSANLDPLTTYTRGGIVTRPDGQKGREPYVSDIEPPKQE
eukprot:SM000331S12518  [mRNA]  locus=s331:62010:63375:+ [translate_table: standard]